MEANKTIVFEAVDSRDATLARNGRADRTP
jgi:hypothetical protein